MVFNIKEAEKYYYKIFNDMIKAKHYARLNKMMVERPQTYREMVKEHIEEMGGGKW